MNPTKTLLAVTILSLGVFLNTAGCSPAASTVAAPSFDKAQCQSRQAEAKSNLQSLFVSQEIYRAMNDTYSMSFDKIEFKPSWGGKELRYIYSMEAVKGPTFRAKAVGQGEMAGDIWTIDETNKTATNTSTNCK